MEKTSVLPPITAVRMVWARTGMFSDDAKYNNLAVLVEAELKDIKARVEQGDKKKEKEYVYSALAAMEATLRNLAVIYKGRELNFQENEKLRATYLESIRENLDFGNKAKDFLKSLPAMSIGGAGSITVAKSLGSDIPSWALGIAVTGLGYVINMIIIKCMRRRKQMLYVKQDYDRNVYFDQYVSRVETTLTSMYLDMDRIHRNVFGQTYPVDTEVNEIVEEMLKGVRSTSCKFIYKHIYENKITPELWSLCETGDGAVVKQCKFWEDKR